MQWLVLLAVFRSDGAGRTYMLYQADLMADGVARFSVAVPPDRGLSGFMRPARR
jgi:hypothetical protein